MMINEPTPTASAPAFSPVRPDFYDIEDAIDNSSPTPMTRAQIVAVLASLWPDHSNADLTDRVRAWQTWL